MKEYWSIPGPSKAPLEHCLAFKKYDGSNIRCEWSKKRGWYKFGTRTQIIDRSAKTFGAAIPLFESTLAAGIEKVIIDDKKYRNIDGVTVFCEFFGPNSFAGWHDDNDVKELVLIDVNINKKGIVLPRDFVKEFGHLRSAECVYDGNFNAQFRQDVMDGKYPVWEGVVAKGVLPGGKNPQHGLWMAKVKTKAWVTELRKRVTESKDAKMAAAFASVLADTEIEQEKTEKDLTSIQEVIS